MGRWSRKLAVEFAAFAGVRDGTDVLDIGSGTGALSSAVRAAAPKARIKGIDLSPAFVELARRQHADLGIEFQTGDAQALPFAPASFDTALTMLVINFVPDPVRAIEEMKRVTRPGGTLAAALWDIAGEMEMLRIFFDEAGATNHHDERLTALLQPGALVALFRRCGLAADEQALEVPMHFASFDDYWSPFLLGVGPAGAHVAELTPHDRDALVARLRARLGDGPFDLEGRAWAVKATR
ncbi:MAG: class I SAM-dependent methyltransferase [Deltaproteobacteria bacterium]